MQAHMIRLRVPWKITRIASDEAAGQPVEMLLVERWFNRPTGLGGERVHLCIDPQPQACVRLNEVELQAEGAAEPDNAVAGGTIFRCDVTSLLRPRNQVTIILPRNEGHAFGVELPAAYGEPQILGSLPWQVWLEILSEQSGLESIDEAPLTGEPP